MRPVKVSKKGQITIPKDIRDQLNLEPGEEVEFARTNAGFVLRRKNPEPFPEVDVEPDDPLAKTPEQLLDLTRGDLD